MADTDLERVERAREASRSDRSDGSDRSEGPRQEIRRMPDDEIQGGGEVGPFFPSGMSAPEAALAGATADMNDDEIAQVKGERVKVEDDGQAVQKGKGTSE